MPDAAVTIKLNLEPGDVKKTAAELQREVKNIFDQTGGHGSRDMSALLLQLKQAYAELDKLTGELEKAQSTRVLDPENAQDLKILERDLRQAASEYAKITEQMQQMKAAGMENTAEFGKLRNSANLVAQSMERIKWEMEIVKEYAQVDANATEQAANAVDLQNDKISLLLQKYMELTAQPKKQSKAWDNVRKAISGVEKIAKKAMSKIRSGFDKVNHSIKHGIKNLMRYALGIRGAYMLVRKIRAAFKEGITNLAKFDSQANETLSSFTTDIQYMKNSLGAMLMPLAELVIPIFRNITDAVVKATESVSQFFAAFAGTGKVYKAIRVQKDFAESTEAAAATVNKSLAGYDKLQVISKASSSASSDDSTKAFELVEVEQKYQDLAGASYQGS